MHRSSALRRILPLLALAFAALLLGGCGNEALPQDSAQTPAPSATPQAQVVAVSVVSTEAPAAPTVPPTPVPEETPIPFSYYAPTVNMTFEELVGSTDDVYEEARDLLKDGYPDPDTYYIIVDIEWQVVMVYKKGADGKPDLNQPVRYMICSTGDPQVGSETARGVFEIKKPRVRFGQFLSGETAQYWTLIRSRTYFHSVLYKKDKDISSYDVECYNNLGSKASHACIRLTVPDARWIFYNIGYGTICEIRDGSPSDTATQAIRSQLILPPAKEGLKLKAGETPWTDNWTVESVAHELEYQYEAPPRPAEDDDEGDTTPAPDEQVTPAPGTPTPGGSGGGTTGGDTTGGDTTGGGTTGGDTTGGDTTGGDTTGGGTTGGDTAEPGPVPAPGGDDGAEDPPAEEPPAEEPPAENPPANDPPASDGGAADGGEG